MAENLCCSLALAFTRQEKLNNDALIFLANNGNYTQARRKEGIKLLVDLIPLRNEFEKIDEEWERIVHNIVDTAEKADAEALYFLHAFGTGDPNKIPYRLIIGDISEIIGEVETELFFITRDLKGTSWVSSNNTDVVFASIRKEYNRAIVVASSLEKASVAANEQLSHHAVADHDVELNAKITYPKKESSFVHKENPIEILLDRKDELEKSSKVANLGKIFCKIKAVEKKKLSKKRQFFNVKFSEAFVEKWKKNFIGNHVYDFKNEHFDIMIKYAIIAVIFKNYKKKRKC